MIETPVWFARAACKGDDTDKWFEHARMSEGKAICNKCPVKSQCLEYAVETGETWGIWGGVGYRERARIRKLRGLPRLSSSKG